MSEGELIFEAPAFILAEGGVSLPDYSCALIRRCCARIRAAGDIAGAPQTSRPERR